MRQSKADRVYQHLRRLIREMELPPGAPIQKDEIAEALGVSRAPVGEAINRLAEEMLVDIYPRHGSFVAPIRADGLRESMFLRIALEVEAARRLTAAGDSAVVDRLEQNLDQQQRALVGGNLFLFYDLDADFHAIVLQATGFRRAAHIGIIARVSMDRPRQFGMIMSDRAATTFQEHRRVVDAIALKDPDFAATAMRSHLQRASQSMEEALKELPPEDKQSV